MAGRLARKGRSTKSINRTWRHGWRMRGTGGTRTGVASRKCNCFPEMREVFRFGFWIGENFGGWKCLLVIGLRWWVVFVIWGRLFVGGWVWCVGRWGFGFGVFFGGSGSFGGFLGLGWMLFCLDMCWVGKTRLKDEIIVWFSR